MKLFNQIVKTFTQLYNISIISNKKRKINNNTIDNGISEHNQKIKKVVLSNNHTSNDDVIIINNSISNIKSNNKKHKITYEYGCSNGNKYINEKKSLFEGSIIALNVLEKLEFYLNMKPIDLDLANSNLITKLIENGMVKKILIMFLILSIIKICYYNYYHFIYIIESIFHFSY